MAKRPQGLHKSAQAKKKQKVSKKESEETSVGTTGSGALEFEGDVDPNDELSSLIAMYTNTLGNLTSQKLDQSNPIHQLSPEKISSMIIHSCDNILRLHSKKTEQSADDKKDGISEDEVNPIELLPEVLPAQFHNIYAVALLRMAKVLQGKEQDEDLDNEEDEDEDSLDVGKNGESSSSKKARKTEKDTPIDFINAAIERCEIGLETFPDFSDLLFTFAAAKLGKVSNSIDNGEIESFEEVSSGLFKSVKKAMKTYKKALELVEKESQGKDKQAIELLFTNETFSTLESLLGIADAFSEGDGEFNDLSDKCLSWGINSYKDILKILGEQSEPINTEKDKKGKGNAKTESVTTSTELIRNINKGLGQYYMNTAGPLVEKYEDFLELIPDDEDEDEAPKSVKDALKELEELRNKAQSLLKSAVQHFLKAEPEEEAAQNDEGIAEINGEYFAHTAEAQIALGNLYEAEEDQEKFYKQAVHRLRLAQRLGAGDFSEQIRELS